MNSLKRNANTLERIPMCGYAEEHAHTSDCYAGDALVCGRAEHVHTDACYQQSPDWEDLTTELSIDDSTPQLTDSMVGAGDLDLDLSLDDLDFTQENDDDATAQAVSNGADSAPGAFALGREALVSGIIEALGMEIASDEIDEVGVVDDGETETDLIGIERIDGDFRVWANRDFAEARLALIAANGVTVVRLVDGVAAADGEEQTPETAQPEGEAYAAEEPSAVEAETSAEAPSVSETQDAGEATPDTEDASVEAEQAPEEEETVDGEKQAIEEEALNGESEEPTEATGKSTEEAEGQAEAAVEPTEEAEKQTEVAEAQAGEARAEAQPKEVGEQSKEAEEQTEEPTEEAEDQAEATEEQTESTREAEEQAEVAEEQTEEPAGETEEPTGETEKPTGEAEEPAESETKEQAGEPLAYSATIDLAEVDGYPLSLNAMLARAAGDVDKAEEAGTEAGEAGEDESHEPEAPAEEAPAWTLEYDRELLDVVEADGDHLITPLRSFENTTIIVENGSRYALTLVNCAFPEAEGAQAPAFPAQDFEGHTAFVKVAVSAPEGAFPAGTAMAVADVADDDTLENIEAAVSDDFVEVRRVQAVDITFTDADGNEIEPLLPISVVMTVAEIDRNQDAVVVHVDGEGEAEVVEQHGEAAADPSGVAFSADSFSVYAIVLTETIETKYIDAEGDTWNITLGYGAQAGIPAGARLAVAEVPAEDYLGQAAEALPETRHITGARFFDITILDAEGNAVQPAQAVTVNVALADETEGHVDALHFADDGVEVLPAGRNGEAAVVFSAEGFSVYGIVYTVDFHYDVDGRTYDLSIPGGGWLSLRALVRALDIVQDDPETGLDEVRAFVDDVADVAFSAPGLVNVSRVEQETTVGRLKQALGLECEYSADLTEAEIAEIDAARIEPVDWALISLKPFDTEETLTVTMKDGDRFEIRVTDAQISSAGELTDGKKYIIYTIANIEGVKQNVALKKDGTYGIVSSDGFDSLGDEYRWTYSYNGGSPTWTNGDTFIDVFSSDLAHPVNNVKSTNGWMCGFSITPKSDGKDGFDFKDLYQPYYLNWNLGKGGFIRNEGSGCRMRIWVLPDDYAFTVSVDDTAHGSVSGYGVDGRQLISQARFTTPGKSSGNVYVNAQRIVATSKTGWKFKEWQLRDAWNGTVKTYSDRLLLEGSVELNSDNMTLVAVYEKGEEPEWGEDDTVGQLLAEWKKGLTTESIKTDKTARVYDYDNRIYQIDLKASSGRRAANPSVVINFITDTSRSMFFPANIYQVGSFANGSAYYGGLNYWLNTGEDKTGNVYYVIADQNDSATMYAVYFDHAANAWKFVDASYYQAEDGRTTTVYDVATDINYSNGHWTLRSNNFVLETAIYQAPKKEPGKLWTRLDYLCVAVEKATGLVYEIDPNAEVHLTTFNKTAAYVGKFGKNRSEIESMLRLISLSGGTRQDKGLQAAIDAGIFSNGNDKQQVAVLITDGAPNIKGETGIDWSTVWGYIEDNAWTLKSYRDASGKNLTLYTLGLFLERVGQNASRLDGIASAGKAGRADSSEDIARTIENIIEGILQEVNLQGAVTDTVDPAFYPVRKDGTPLGVGDTFTDDFGHTGTVGRDDNGNWTVTWTEQSFAWPDMDASGNITRPGWQGRLYVKAKEDFLGGNTVSTNAGAKAEADRYLFGNQSYTLDSPVRVSFDTPYVNVDELSLTHNDTQWTVYLGTEVDPLAQVRKLFGEILVNEVVTRTVDGKHVVMTGSGDTLYPVTESDDDGRTAKNGAVPETFRLTDVVTLSDDNWADLVAGGTVTVPYGAYGHSGVGSIVITLEQAVVSPEDDLTPSPHATTVTGQGVERYTLTATYVPAGEHDPATGWHTTPGGSRGKAADDMPSANTHVVNAFAKGLTIRKMDNMYEKTLTGAQFRLYRPAKADETQNVMKIGNGNYVPASGVYTVNDDGIAEIGDIPAGDYYLVETRAPDGYNIAEPMQVKLTIFDGEKAYVPDPRDTQCPYNWAQTASLVLDGTVRRSDENWQDYSADVTPNSETATVYYRIPNNPGVSLPATGGPGTAVYYIAGAALLFLGLVLLLRRESEY